MKKQLAVSSALAAVLLSAGPASADPWTSLPPDLQWAGFACDGSLDYGGLLEFVSGPATTPMGTGSMRLWSGPNDATGISEEVSSLGSVDTWSASLRPSDGNDAVVVAGFQDPGSPYTLIGLAGATADTWTQVDLANLPLHVFNQDLGGMTGDTSSIAGWDALGHGDGPAYIEIYNVPCFLQSTTAETLNIDGLSVGQNSGPVTTYDFEQGDTLSLSMRATKGTIVRGKSTRLSTTAVYGRDTFSGLNVQLWAKPKGATKFTRVATVPTNADGVATRTVKPRKTTTYQWRYADDHASPAKTITVKAG